MSLITIQEFNEIIKEDIPCAVDISMVLEKVSAGKATMRLPYDACLTRPGGSISGPHMMMLADICMFAVVLSLIGKVKLAVTTNFNINFLRKPTQCDLIAVGDIIKIGKRLAIMEVSIYTSDENKLVAHATGTYSIPNK